MTPASLRCLVSAVLPCYATAGCLRDTFIDPSNGQFDVCRCVAGKKGVVPIPTFISEPAVGYGGGAVLLYFHDKSRVPNIEGSPFDPPITDRQGR
jgi:hypothetical protein